MLSFLSVSMTAFCIFMAEYAWRRSINRPFHKSVEYQQIAMDRHMKMLIGGVCISTAFVYIRYVPSHLHHGAMHRQTLTA